MFYNIFINLKVQIHHAIDEGEPGFKNDLDLMFCNQGGVLTCCFTDEKCEQNWYAINNQVNS